MNLAIEDQETKLEDWIKVSPFIFVFCSASFSVGVGGYFTDTLTRWIFPVTLCRSL